MPKHILIYAEDNEGIRLELPRPLETTDDLRYIGSELDKLAAEGRITQEQSRKIFDLAARTYATNLARNENHEYN